MGLTVRGFYLRWPRMRAAPRGGATAASIALALILGTAAAAGAQEARALGLAAIHHLTGCFLVDYSFVEVESLKPGYVRDPRVYDVNVDKSVKEQPLTTLAVAAGIGFVIGALWKS